MADLFDLVAKLTLDSSEYSSGLDSALGKAKSIGGTIAKVGAAGVTALAGAAVGATTALTKTVSETAAYGDNIDKMSQKMGLSAQAYQEWDAIMQHSGTSMESLKAGMKTLANAVENDNKAFGRLGITQEQIASMNQEELFSATISALQNVDDETERTYLAGQLLGRGATELGALLNTSAEDTEKMRQRVHELGGVMSDDAVKAAAAFQDNMQDLQTTVDGVKRGFTQALLPGFNDVLSGFTSLIAGEEGAEEQLTSGISNIVQTFSEMSPRITEVLTGVGGAIISVLPQVAEGAVSIVTTLGSTLLSSAPQLIDSAIAIVGVLVDGITQAAPQLVTGAMQLVTELANGLAQMAPTLITGITSAVAQMAIALTDPGMLGQLIQGAIALVQGIADGIMQAAPILIAAAPVIIQNLVDAVVQNAPSLIIAAGQLIIQLGVGLILAIPQILSALPQIVDSIGQGLIDLAPQLLEAGKSLAKSAWEGIKSIFSGNKEEVDVSESVDVSGLEAKSQTAANAVSSISAAAGQTATEVSSSFATISAAADMSGLVTNAETSFSGITTAAETTKDGVVTAFTTMGTDMTTAVNDTVTAVTTSTPQMSTSVEQTFQTAANNAVAAWNPVPSEFSRIWGEIASAMNISEATSWGADMVSNFISGINSKLGELRAKVQEMASLVKSNIGFSEPSDGPLSDFHTYAPDMMDLFMQGITDNEDRLRDTVQNAFDFRDAMTAPETMTYSATGTATQADSKIDAILDAIHEVAEALRNQTIEMDGEKVADLIDSRLGSKAALAARV